MIKTLKLKNLLKLRKPLLLNLFKDFERDIYSISSSKNLTSL